MFNKKSFLLHVLCLVSFSLFSVSQVILDQKDTELLEISDSQVIDRSLSFSHSRVNALADFSGVRVIKGDLVLINMSGNYTDNFFPSLENIEGDLIIIGNDDLKNITFPSLSVIKGELIIRDNSLLSEIRFSSLNVSGSLKITRHNLLAVLDFPVLVSSGKVVLKDLQGVRQCDFPLLETIDSFSMAFCEIPSVGAGSLKSVSGDIRIQDSETEIDFSSLTDCGGLLIHRVGMSSVSLPLTEDIRGDFELNGSGITSVNLPLLKQMRGSVMISRNDGLLSVALKSLQNISGNLTVWENKVLKTFTVSSSLQLGSDNGGSLIYIQNQGVLSGRQSLLRSLSSSNWSGTLTNGRL